MMTYPNHPFQRTSDGAAETATLPLRMLPYTIDDTVDCPLQTSVEVTIEFSTGKRWLFFATPGLLASVGDFVDGTRVRVHLGEKHMIVVSELDPGIIDAVLNQLHSAGELESRTLPIYG
jgi:hypothetical protein